MARKVLAEAKREHVPFGELLRRLRLAAGLTQEELAERAEVTDRAIRDLERAGGRTPRLQTVRLLARALDLDDDGRAYLLAAARPRAQDAPPPHDADRLPLVLTPLVGRSADLAVVSMALEERRLVTISGTGGVGKTRLAIAVAERTRERFDRILFVDLVPVKEPRHMLDAVAATLSLREEGSATLFDLVSQTLRPKRLLLVLDNMEHLLEARETVLALLDACRSLSMLITSREALWRFWSNGGYLTEGRQWLRQVLDLVPRDKQASAGVLAARERIWELEPEALREARAYLERVSAQWDVVLARLQRFVEMEETDIATDTKQL